MRLDALAEVTVADHATAAAAAEDLLGEPRRDTLLSDRFTDSVVRMETS